MGLGHRTKDEAHDTKVEKADGAQKGARLRDWKGLVPVEAVGERRAFFAVTSLLSLVSSFLQFGFYGIGLGQDSITYVLGLLLPVTVTTLLLGRSWGMLSGVVAGITQSLHAFIQPLDLYELYFVRPVTSILLYVLVSAFLGLCFSIALKRDPERLRRKIYLFVCCFLTSIFATILFLLNVIGALILSTVESTIATGTLYVSVQQLEAITEIRQLSFCVTAADILDGVFQLVGKLQRLDGLHGKVLTPILCAL